MFPPSRIVWVAELVEIAGGTDIFADRGDRGAAKDLHSDR
jgi:hypothetical protein